MKKVEIDPAIEEPAEIMHINQDRETEDSTRIILSGTFQLITEKNTPIFLWYPRLIFSAPQHLVFPAGCSQRNAPKWTPSVKDSLYKTTVDCLHVNSSSRDTEVSSGAVVHLYHRALNAL
ncbi:hypothetical protein TNCV_2594851 [Trichonephila clavipes]|nr:hypothetical protein TNCV_2594851 [Trichonephila clavipes]